MTIYNDTAEPTATLARKDQFGQAMAAHGWGFHNGFWVRGNVRIHHRPTFMRWRQDGELPPWARPVRLTP